MKEVYLFFSELRGQSGAIWVEGEALKISAPSKFQDSKTKEFLLKNKAKLLAILSKNGVFTKKDFLQKEILADNQITEYPLSPAQERLWFIERYEEGTNAYHVPEIYLLEPSVEMEGVKHAIRQIGRSW
jgi:hypothetical protein